MYAMIPICLYPWINFSTCWYSNLTFQILNMKVSFIIFLISWIFISFIFKINMWNSIQIFYNKINSLLYQCLFHYWFSTKHTITNTMFVHSSGISTLILINPWKWTESRSNRFKQYLKIFQSFSVSVDIVFTIKTKSHHKLQSLVSHI